MAVTASTLTFTPDVWSWNGPPGRYRDQTRAARAEIAFTGGQTILAAGVGDESITTLDFTLPRNFSYVLMEASLRIKTAVDGATNNMDLNSSLGLFRGATQQWVQGTSPGVTFDTGGADTFNETKIYTYPEIPTGVLIPLSGNNVFINIKVSNNVQDDAAYSAVPFVRVLQFDLEQAFYEDVNNPVPVR